MLFNSLPFLYGFLPVTYLVFWKLTTRNARYAWLAVTGYVFYSFWNYKFCALMALSTLVSYAAGLGLLRWSDTRRRRLCLVLPIAFDLLLLGIFKYADFTIQTFNAVAAFLGLHARGTYLSLVLPVGISFYTFHTITYVVDCYRGTVKPTRNFLEFSCYVSLFAQLVAGPIVRFREIERDLEAIDGHDRIAGLGRGGSLFAIGLAKKVLLADSIALVIDPALNRYADLSTIGAWLCALGYSYQLYFDFSGYADMAIGLGHMFGLRLPKNFDSPYTAVDISDFWRRWHISLSAVLRDYIYIPLGGNRGPRLMVYRNLMMTMLLGGLWHGANWTFVCWGGYHGALLCAYRFFRDRPALPAPAARLGTFLLVVVGWVLFRSTTFRMAFVLLARMFSWSPGAVPVGTPVLVAMVLVAVGLAHFGPNTGELPHVWKPAAAWGLTALFATSLLAVYGGRASPFLYFQF